jgi:hypothetical protein
MAAADAIFRHPVRGRPFSDTRLINGFALLVPNKVVVIRHVFAVFPVFHFLGQRRGWKPDLRSLLLLIENFARKFSFQLFLLLKIV